MDRRLFISQLGLATLASCAQKPSTILQYQNTHNFNFLNPDTPKAIAMWDFSWLLRRYPHGGFEDWDKALDELVERGYNALRIDCFPQFISQDDDQNAISTIHLPKKGHHPTPWGNERSIDITPRNGLITFLQKCQKRNISIALSSWFLGHGTDRNLKYIGEDGLVRAWDETLSFLKENDLLKNILYIDILNEYPLWHGYQWLTDQLSSMATRPKAPFDFLNLDNRRQFSSSQIQFYNTFINKIITRLSNIWPQLKFTVSQTNTLNTPWQDLDNSHLAVLDIHQWMIYNQSFSRSSGYFNGIHKLKNIDLYKTTYQKMTKYWIENKSALSQWLSETMKERHEVAHKLTVPLGCTEGWGAVMWAEHVDLDWTFIKECGLIAADLGVKYQYSFNCSSNFTHPQFTGLWSDIPWHREVTKRIRKL